MKKLTKKQMIQLIQEDLMRRGEGQPITQQEQIAITEVLASPDNTEFVKNDTPDTLSKSEFITDRAAIPYIQSVTSAMTLEDPVTITLGHKNAIFEIQSPFNLVQELYNANNGVCKVQFDVKNDAGEIYVRVNSLSEIFYDKVIVSIISAVQSAAFNSQITTGGSPVINIVKEFDESVSENNAHICNTLSFDNDVVNSVVSMIEKDFPKLFVIDEPYFYNNITVLDTVNMVCVHIYQYLLRNSFLNYNPDALAQLNRFAICLYDNLVYEFSNLCVYRRQLMQSIIGVGPDM